MLMFTRGQSMFGSFLDIFHWVLSHFWKFGSPSVFKKQFIQKKIHHLRWFPLLTWRNISLNHQKTWVSRWPSPFFQLFFPHFPHVFPMISTSWRSLEIFGAGPSCAAAAALSSCASAGRWELALQLVCSADLDGLAGAERRPGWWDGYITSWYLYIIYIYDDGIYNWLVVLNGGRWYK